MPPIPAAIPPAPFVPRAPLLPPVGDFLREVLSLGRKSILPALPALVLLYFYRLGMGLYLVFAGDTTSPLGFPDYQGRAVTWIVTATAYLPLLVLVYTPFLPLQDGLIRGTKRTFVESIKHVLELLWPYGVSSFYQLLIIAIPAAGIMVLAALAMMPLTNLPEQIRALLLFFALIPAGLWILAAMFLLSFATPLLILDGWGPAASIRESVRLVRRSFGALFGRFFIFAVVLVFAGVAASFPSAMLNVVTTVARQKMIAADIARVFWDSLVSTALFPFTIAGLLLIYRAIVPGTAAADRATADRAEAGSPGAAEPPQVPIAGPTTTTTSPYQFE
ncbi:MAG TPA: hypothetical protein VFS09_02275 [Candidatus Eisenbacteria bacterium]|nr:hypothetical protein [Candidatus Eisenbacteria bacterium]